MDGESSRGRGKAATAYSVQKMKQVCSDYNTYVEVSTHTRTHSAYFTHYLAPQRALPPADRPQRFFLPALRCEPLAFTTPLNKHVFFFLAGGKSRKKKISGGESSFVVPPPPRPKGKAIISARK